MNRGTTISVTIGRNSGENAMAESFNELLHDLANKVNSMGGAAWLALAATTNEGSLYGLLSEIERAMKIVLTMQRLIAAERGAQSGGPALKDGAA